MECLVQNKHQKEMNDKCSVGVTHFQLVSVCRCSRTVLMFLFVTLEVYKSKILFISPCPRAPPPDSDERLQVLLQVQDGVQGGRPPLVSQHQEEVGVKFLASPFLLPS